MTDRQQRLAALQQAPAWDLLVIGGGITGAGVAREAARRGLRVALVEARDFAWGTSSRSSKMVHGGLRYLGSGQLGLTRESLRERETLLAEAPGLIDRLPYLFAHQPGKFPGRRVFGALLSVYDWLSGHRAHGFLDRTQIAQWLPDLDSEPLSGASWFSDALVDDSRLVMRVLQEAQTDGAVAVNYLRATELLRAGDQVTGAKLQCALSGQSLELKAKLTITATGAWTDQLRQALGHKPRIRPLRGSHVVIPFWRLPLSCAVLLKHPADGRPVFIYPWEGVSVVGTTDLDHTSDLSAEPVISQAEADYLLQAANCRFPALGLGHDDVISTWSGVRPVVSSGGSKSPSAESREHAIWQQPGLISIAGGKLTTFREIACDALARADEITLAQNPSGAKVFRHNAPAQHRPRGITLRQWQRLKGQYASALGQVLAAGPLERIGHCECLLAEAIWSCGHEQVQHLDDLMLRRLRIGMLLPEGGRDWLQQQRPLLQTALDWDDSRWHSEYQRYIDIWQKAYAPCPWQTQHSAS